MAITMFVSLYTTRLILSGLGASDFGIYNIVGSAIHMLGFLNAAMAGATQRFMNYAEGEGNFEKKKTIFNVSVTLHYVIAALVALVLIVAGFFFFNGILNIPEERVLAAEVVYCCLIASTVFSVTSVPYEAVLNSHENMKYYSIVGVFEALLKLSVAFACVYTTGDKLVVYGVLMALIPFITRTIQRVYCYRHYSECVYKPRVYYDKTIAKEMTSFAGWGFVNSTASMLTMQGMSILLNMFGGVVVNAAHGVANQLAGQLMVFSHQMLKALNPVLVKSRGAGKNQQMLEAASTGNKMSYLIYTFFAIPFIIETPYILSIWLKDVPEWAVLFVRLVLIRQMVSQISVTLDTCINATGRVKRMTINSSIIWISPIIIGYFMYKYGAPIYTIYILLILMAFCRVYNSLYFCHKQCGLKIKDYLLKTFMPCFIQTVVLIVVLLVIVSFIDESLSRLLIVLFLSFICHPISSYFIGFNDKEKVLFYNILTTLKRKFIRKSN